mmetsp:Transcript_14036/g.15217  ORF Transcript_14036/g.15217 Transcript_14036/m.15217 type:complete len:192 (+) Transcript_14036:61-636(+)
MHSFHLMVSWLSVVLIISILFGGILSIANGEHNVCSLGDKELRIMKQHQNDIATAARRHGIDPALLAAIISRESNGGLTLDKNGYGDKGKAFGVAQIDQRYHNQLGKESRDPWSPAHLDQACTILQSNKEQVRKKHPSWTDAQVERGAVAAYNFGVKNVLTVEGIDRGTTGNNYSEDVLKRRQRFRSEGFI